MNHEKFYFDHNTGFWHPIDFYLSHCEKCDDVHETKFVKRGVCEDELEKLRSKRGSFIDSNRTVRWASFVFARLSMWILVGFGLVSIIYAIRTPVLADGSISPKVLAPIGLMLLGLVFQNISLGVKRWKSKKLREQFDAENSRLVELEAAME